jgi:chloramphenicol 3-O-phosphotransferase
MKLVFLYGPPAGGKLTVARELAALTGYRLFHNHLTIDLVLSLFDFGTPGFIALRDRVWMAAFSEACANGLEGMIFTYAPEPSVPEDFVGRVRRLVEGRGGEVVFVSITAPVEVLEARISQDSRKAFGKITDVALFRDLWDRGLFADAAMPAPRLTIDTHDHTPAEAAQMIVGALG